jgi:hypothetical protein
MKHLVVAAIALALSVPAFAATSAHTKHGAHKTTTKHATHKTTKKHKTTAHKHVAAPKA